MGDVTGFRPVRWVVHHSESPGGGKLFIMRVARENQNIDFCPYHFIISNGRDWGGFHEELSDGMLILGRDDTKAGQHCRHHNSSSLGVCLVGDFTKHRPTTAQLDTLIALLEGGFARFGISPIFNQTVFNHKDMPQNSTTCPGEYMYDMTRRCAIIAYERIIQKSREGHAQG